MENTEITALKTDIQTFESQKETLVELVQSTKGITCKGIDDKEGYEKVCEVYKSIKDKRIAIEKQGKGLRDLITPISKHISAKEKELVDILDPEETRLKSERDKYDNEKKRIKEEKERAAEKILNDRCSELMSVHHMVFSGSEYTIGHGAQIMRLEQKYISELNDEQFKTFLHKCQTISIEIETANRAELERVKKEEEEKEAKRKEEEAELKRQQDEVKKQQEEIDRQKKELARIRLENRTSILTTSGWVKRESVFIKEDVSIANIDILEMPDILFTDHFNRLNTTAEENKVRRENKEAQDKEAARLAGIEQERKSQLLKSRKESLKPYDVKDSDETIVSLSDVDFGIWLASLRTEVQDKMSDKEKLADFISCIKDIPVPKLTTNLNDALNNIMNAIDSAEKLIS